ncbi:high-affinity iron transporter [Paenibacillus tianmuensis]|uniref:High-affinity iron transporter n=1 Tax=Paenibacillus tianmuensis TaxID=624147 RepID=A0A1G4T110_9BACL|nr:FTR1 family protein [Paenibacillus tianmuensis]SCW74219.1 high-affinity iron transporter [Paenibacillus tianmuensis]
MPLVGGALVHAGEHKWQETAAELEKFEAEWRKLNALSGEAADSVASALADAKKAVTDAASKPNEAYQSVSKLTKAVGRFAGAGAKKESKADGKQAAGALLPILRQTQADIQNSDWDKARSRYKQFDSQWSKSEAAIRSDSSGVYGQIETKLSLIRIALQAEPPKAEAADKGVRELIQLIDDYVSGKLREDTAASGKQSVSDALAILQKAADAISAGRNAEAADQLQAFIQIWPSVEGEVRTRAPDTYDRIEREMTEAASRLLSNPPQPEEAGRIVSEMQTELQPFTAQTSYSAWDAAIILLREGLEALLAFLRRTGNASKQVWVWSGGAAGLLASGGLAVVLTFTIANVASGSTRELLEGIMGLVSVFLMLTVGAWLHRKSHVDTWNRYINNQVGVALASGNLWSLFLVAALSILREGAETAIFYIGMAPSIDPAQLALGIGSAAVLLFLLGFVIVRGSVLLPLRPFFLGATVLIYYLVLKFLGQSIHALQIAGQIPAHVPGYLPSWNWLGAYPTWETFVPQVLVLLFIVFQWARQERKMRGNVQKITKLLSRSRLEKSRSLDAECRIRHRKRGHITAE